MKPIILLGKAQIFLLYYAPVSMRCDPLVQRRHPDTQIVSHLSARQRNAHRILAEFVSSSTSHSSSPLLQ